MPDFFIAHSALNALDTNMSVSAGNIANVSTEGFNASRVVLQSGPENEGVRVSAVYRDMSSGPAVINHLTDLPREFATHMAVESAYSATAAVIRAMDELTGSILNVKV